MQVGRQQVRVPDQVEEAAQARSKAMELARSQRQWALIRRLEDWEASQTAK